MTQESVYDQRSTNGDIHGWFELTYSNYLVLQRSLLQEMPEEWQARFVACLEEMREATRDLDPTPADSFTVMARGDRGRFAADPYRFYRYSDVPHLEIPIRQDVTA